MTVFYHHPMSAGSRAVRLLLSEYGVRFQLVQQDPWQPNPEFKAMNPALTLPVLMQEQTPIIGAMVVAEYIDETLGTAFGDNRLYPQGSRPKAEMRRICDWALTKLHDEVIHFVVHERVVKRILPMAHGGGAPDSSILRMARGNIAGHIEYLNRITEARDWMAGPKITFADLAVAGALSVLDYMGEINWTENSLKNWYARIKSRPSFRPLLAERLRGVSPVSHYVDLDF